MKKTVVITGSSSGIGAAIAREFAGNKNNIVINYKSNKTAALELLIEVRSKGSQAIAIGADVSDFAQAENLINSAIEQFGRVDILVNNAGISKRELFTDITPEAWEEIFKVNVHSAFYCSNLAVKDMLKRHFGKIINISSVWGITGASCEVHYSSTKAALIGLTKALAKELGPSNITVNCVAPGVIKTKMNEFLIGDEINDLNESTPLGRMGEPCEVAKLVKFLASSEADFITGQVVSPNGGFLI